MKLKSLFLTLLLLFVFSTPLVFSLGGVSIVPSAPTDNDDLTCTLQGVSPANSGVYLYGWYVNGNLDTTLGNTRIYPALRTSIGNRISCFVTTPAGFFVGSDTVTVRNVNNPPMVSITSPVDGSTFEVTTQINFAAMVLDLDMDPVTYSWDFGDGTASSLSNPIHSYSLPGTYVITLVVSDGVSVSTHQITVHVTQTIHQNQNPVSVLTATPTTVFLGTSILFDGRGSTDSDGTLVLYEWNFGDGVITSTNSGVPTLAHVYTISGTYVATLTVVDNEGARSSSSVSVTVRNLVNQVPVANAGPDRRIAVGQRITFDARGSSDSDGTIVIYKWNFGDGTSDGGLQVQHIYQNVGSYTVTLSIEDNDGAISTDTALVRVVAVGTNPVAVITVLPNTNIAYLGFPLEFSGIGSYDLDGTLVDYQWNFGDGTSSRGVQVHHTYETLGNYVVTLTVTDNDGLTGTVTVPLQVINVQRDQENTPSPNSPTYGEDSRIYSISKITPLIYKQHYVKGENILLFVKLVNTGNFDEVLDLKLNIPEFNYMTVLRGINLDINQNKFVTLSIPISTRATKGIHVAKFELLDESGVRSSNNYWTFIVA